MIGTIYYLVLYSFCAYEDGKHNTYSAKIMGECAESELKERILNLYTRVYADHDNADYCHVESFDVWISDSKLFRYTEHLDNEAPRR